MEDRAPLVLILSSRQSKWSISHSGHFVPWERAPLNIAQEAEWGQVLVWVFLKKYLALAEIQTLDQADSLVTTLNMLFYIHLYSATFPINKAWEHYQ